MTFSCRDKWSRVAVYFEFFNPEAEAKTLMVGFVAPMPGGDVNEKEAVEKRIQQFQVQANGALLPYELKMAECPDCPLQDLSEWNFSQHGGEVLVYLFQVTFQPGVTKVNHSYRFPASNNVSVNEIYEYTLSTGSKWAGNTIQDFSLEIDFPPNAYLYLTDIFPKTAQWTISGTGKITDESLKNYAPVNYRLVRLIEGRLHIHVTDFKPKGELEFGSISSHGFMSYLLHSSTEAEFMVCPMSNRAVSDCDRSYTKDELRILRNAIYAEYGYVFQSADLQTFFEQFGWYIPDPNLKLEDIQLSPLEKAFVAEIVQAEKKLQ